MTFYRLYHMDPHTGHILRFEEFETPHRAEAIARAEWSCGSGPVELWANHCKLHRVEPPHMADARRASARRFLELVSDLP